MCLPVFREAKIEENMTKELLIKFLNNNYSEEELNEVLRWANAESLNEEIRGWIFEDWNSYREVDNLYNDERFTILFDKIQAKIDRNNQNNPKKKINTLTLSMFTKWMTRAAAVLLIPVLTFLFYTLNENRIESVQYSNLATDSLEVIAPIGSRTVVHLSDGSIVQLNYGSRIKYPRLFSGATREVTLAGEGFFNVAHNPEQPFVVKAGRLNVKAVGTAFNVLAYPDDSFIETTLVNGKVALEKIENNGITKSIGTMIPGQHVVYKTNTGAVLSTKGSVEKFISWTEGKLIFEDTPITQIAEKLNRMFNVDIEIKNDVKDLYYTVTLVDEPLYQILDLITIATPVSYRIIPRKKLPNGEFSKQKIIIEKKQ